MNLELDRLCFRYPGREVLRDISARARPGRITALIGPNAAGKSTLLRCSLGLLRPARGTSLLDGLPAHRLGARARARLAAYVPQHPVVSAPFCVEDIVRMGRYALPADEEAVCAALHELDLGGIAGRLWHELSAGQQQRVAMGRAIAQVPGPGLLVLDEPTSAMDLLHAGRLMALLRQRARMGTTILLAMHDLHLAAATADDAWLLEGGTLRAVGPAGTVMHPDRLAPVFGIPFDRIADTTGRIHLVALPPARPEP